MATLLVTSKMHRALAARVEASVRGRKTEEARRAFAKVVVRVGLVLAACAAVTGIGLAIHRATVSREAARIALLAKARGDASALTESDRGTVMRAETWLARLAGPYDGDRLDDALRSPDALAKLLARPMIYVRGATASFASPASIADAESASTKDALVYCLFDPPASRAEKAVLAKVRVAYSGGGHVEEKTRRVRRLADAKAGLPYLLPSWLDRVREAEDERAILALRDRYDRAPIDAAIAALHADVMLVAIDEPGTGAGPTELDGERAHDVRVAFVDLRSDALIARLRLHADPSWISSGKRSEYAAGLDACLTAMDVRDRFAR